ncbi:MFS transporter [Brooklawnia cerclae]|uniref:Sugar phosphate permease n=1 Tax=Brooklawnia cerclae TaxID=349934 RepID=A0ABX0SNQ6_9ACTN|nr:MFS transporter [Brooklawnia cerclae]NIH58401.1 sugar phosphate permease [Brooklawnia cerclae]
MNQINGPTTGRPTRYRWVVMATIFVGYVVCMADRSNIGTLLPFIGDEFHISNTQQGAISSFFFLGYAVSQIPAGLIMGRTGTRKLVSWAIFGFSIVTFLMGFTTTAVMLLVLRLLLGLAEGPTPVGMTSTINNWFPPKEKGTATGLYIASTQFAPVIVPPIVVLLATQWGWRSVFICLAIPGAIMAVVWYLVVRNFPSESRRVNQAELSHISATDAAASKAVVERPWMASVDRVIRRRNTVPLSTNGSVMKSWNVWGDTLAYFFMNNVLYGMLTWIPSYLVAERGYDFVKMGFVASAPAIGGLVGALTGGVISDRVFQGRRKPTMLLTAFFTAVMFVVVLTVPQNTFLVVGSLVLTGFFLNVGWPMFTAYAMGLTTAKTYPFAISLINSGGNLGGFFAPIIVGMLLDSTGGNYSIAFSYFVVVLLIAFGLLISLTEPRAVKPAEALVVE